jgi:hypothetical protein
MAVVVDAGAPVPCDNQALLLEPGFHKLQGLSDDASVETVVHVSGGQITQAELRLPQPTEPVVVGDTTTQPPPAQAGLLRTWGLSLLGAGTACVLGAVLLDAVWLGPELAEYSDARDAYLAARTPSLYRDATARRESAKDARLGVGLTLTVAAGLLATGGTLLVLDWVDDTQPAAWRLDFDLDRALIRVDLWHLLSDQPAAR